MAAMLYSESSTQAEPAAAAEECGTNSCFFCTSPETD